MCFNRQKKEQRLNERKFGHTSSAAALNEREKLGELVREASYLKDLLTDPADKKKMNGIIDGLTYANVTASDATDKLDKNISNLLDDLKILLSKKKRDAYDVTALIDRIVNAVAERATY